MIIKKAKYKKIKVSQSRLVSPEVYGCDECGEALKNFPNEPNRLEITIFYNNKEAVHEHFCCWQCVLDRIPKIKTDHFFDLPYVSFDYGKGKRTAYELVKILTRINK